MGAPGWKANVCSTPRWMLITSRRSPETEQGFFPSRTLFLWERLSLEAVEVKWAALGWPHAEIRGQEVVGL